MNNWLQDYARFLALYGGAAMALAFLTGYLEEATAFIRANRALSAIVIITHFGIFWIDRIAAREKRKVERLRRDLDDDH